MSNSHNLAILGVASVFLYFSGVVVYRAFFHPLRIYPGPWHAKFCNFAWSYHWIKGDYHLWTIKIHETYGSVVRTGWDQLSFIEGRALLTSDPFSGTVRNYTFEERNDSNDTDIYGLKAQGGANLPKDLRRRSEEPNGAPSIIVSNDEDHKRMRRLQAHAFSEKALRAQESVLDGYVNKLIKKLHENVANPASSIVDMVLWYNYTTFDILGDLAFGQSFGGLDQGSLHPWIKMIFNTVKAEAFLVAAREFWKPLDLLIVWLFAPKGLMSVNMEHAMFAYAKSKERLAQGPSDRPDITSYILRHNDEKGMTIPEIETNASLLIVAGSETTATFLSGLTYNLLRNPDILAKLTNLLRTTFETSDSINVLALGQLPYLAAILEEGFRTYPPVPIGLVRRTASDGAMICGRFVPEGVSVTIPQLAAYMSEENFKNPKQFAPERWEKDATLSGPYKDDDRKVLQPFSFGPRNCIGRNLAIAEMRLILAKILWNFDLELMPESRDWDNQKTYALWEKTPLMVKLTARTA
ncbi:hypothetical protein HYFRA_00001912 [Hymenoscyphus fraxineus]|uniref:Uncharacterized protein n=1 Tax=Hymenoscyphus fraxineus TaxID=746836 RepID=A0A9N9KJL3_9HELO|nr:hypothetical protein HYFRA_00001912 [Hymenoscyphus fraxineus]